MEATRERSHAFELFYRSERVGVLRAVSFTIDNRDLAPDVTDEAFEIVVQTMHYEGAFSVVYETEPAAVTRVLVTGCGV